MGHSEGWLGDGALLQCNILHPCVVGVVRADGMAIYLFIGIDLKSAKGEGGRFGETATRWPKQGQHMTPRRVE